MSVDRGHDTTPRYPTEDVDLGTEAQPQTTETYQIPEQPSAFQGNLLDDNDSQQRLVDRTADRIAAGDVPGDDGDRPRFWTKAKALGAGALATVTAAAVFGGLAVANKKTGTSTETLPSPEPSVSAPLVPGATEAPVESTVPTPELPTAETVKFTVNGETVVGIDGYEGIVARLGVGRDNNPNLPAPTEAEGIKIFKSYLNSVQAVTNMEVTPGGEELRREATEKILFKEGTSGDLESQVKRWQADGTKIVEIADPGLMGPPDKNDLAFGQAYIKTKDRTGTETIWYMSASLVNDWGLIHNGNVSRVEEREATEWPSS